MSQNTMIIGLVLGLIMCAFFAWHFKPNSRITIRKTQFRGTSGIAGFSSFNVLESPKHPRIFAAINRNKMLFFKAPDEGSSGGSATAPDPELIKAEAKKLYEAKMKRDGEIDDIVLAVRKRDKKDFAALATKAKKEDWTADQFARAIATSDEFKPFNVIGAGDEPTGDEGVHAQTLEVVGVRGLPVGSPGEAFVASEAYKALAAKLKRGSHAHASVAVETRGFILQAMQAAGFMVRNATMNGNDATSSGLTSIEKLPGVVTLGVRPLRIKDLIAAGVTTSTTIRYIQENTFANGAATVAEGTAKPAASFDLSEVDSSVKKIAVYTKVTDELFADYLAVASYINMRLPYMVERTEEDQLLNGDGTGNNLLGILNVPTIQTINAAGLKPQDAIYKAFTKVRWGNLANANQGGFEPDAIVLHPLDWETIRLSKDNAGQYLGGGPFTAAYGAGPLVQYDSLWGKPVIVTPAIAQNSFLVGAFRLAAQYFQRQGLMIETTNSDQDDFIKNLTTIRAETRLALAVYRPAAFVEGTNLNE